MVNKKNTSKEGGSKKNEKNVIKQNEEGERETTAIYSSNHSLMQDPGDSNSAMTDIGGSNASNYDDRQSFVSSSTLAGLSVNTGDETIVRRGDGAALRHPSVVTNLSVPAGENDALKMPSTWAQGQPTASDIEKHKSGVGCRCNCM